MKLATCFGLFINPSSGSNSKGFFYIQLAMYSKHEPWFTLQYDIRRCEILLQNDITVSLLPRHATVSRHEISHVFRIVYKPIFRLKFKRLFLYTIGNVLKTLALVYTTI